MDVSYQLYPVNLPSESFPQPSPDIELTLFGYVTGSNQRLYPRVLAEICVWISWYYKPITDNWYSLYMACWTRTVYPGKRNKGQRSIFQPPEEGRSVQRPKRCDKHGDKDEDNSPNNVIYANQISFLSV